MKLVTAEQMRMFDRATIENGVPALELMESAGRAITHLVEKLASPKARIVVVAGVGNNGGDGFVAARQLLAAGHRVMVYACDREKIRGDAAAAMHACEQAGVPIANEAPSPENHPDFVIDAIFGTGLRDAPSGVFAAAIARIAAWRAAGACVIAADIPSGLHSDTGVPFSPAVVADHTVTFAFAKRGLVGAPGFLSVGVLHVADIGIPQILARDLQTDLLDENILSHVRRSRPADSNKGTFGHVLIVAGSSGKEGAALLCGTGALRAGAGLATLCAPRTAHLTQVGRPELMLADYDTVEELTPLVAKKSALVIGPGMPQNALGKPLLRLLTRTASEAGVPAIVDADGLNLVAGDNSLLSAKPAWRAEKVLLTPHPGEAARLLGSSTEAVQQDRYAAASALTKKFGATVILKGARSLIASPDGRIAVCPTGSAALAKGGTGDVLAGMCGAIVGYQESMQVDLFTAACIAAYWHGRAGEVAAKFHGEMSVLASDVANTLGIALRTEYAPL